MWGSKNKNRASDFLATNSIIIQSDDGTNFFEGSNSQDRIILDAKQINGELNNADRMLIINYSQQTGYMGLLFSISNGKYSGLYRDGDVKQFALIEGATLTSGIWNHVNLSSDYIWRLELE